jgi:hypothetical protein
MYGLLIQSIIEIIKAKYGENTWVTKINFKKN